MNGSLDTLSVLVLSLVSIAIIIVTYAGIGYLARARRVKQPAKDFFRRYVACFFLMLSLDIALLSVCPSLYGAMCNCTATLVGGILTLAGVTHSVSGPTISLQHPFLAFNVGVGCLGTVLFWAYIALVFAETVATKKQRLTGILIGLAILLAFNFFRITLSIYLEGLTGFNVHNVFYIFNMIFVLLVWFGWLWTIRRRPARVAGAMP